MQTRFTHTNSIKRERGFVLVLAVFIVIMFISVGAIAVDLANLYRAKIRLDRATKAGVLAGLGMRSVEGWQSIYGGNEPQYSSESPIGIPTGNGFDRLLSQVINTVDQNMKLASMTATTSAGAEGQVKYKNFTSADLIDPANEYTSSNTALKGVTYNAQTDTIRLSVEYAAPTYFLGRIPFINTFCNAAGGKACWISSNVQASLAPATIGLILDTSGSMACPSNSSDCSCINDPALSYTCPNPVMNKLKDGVDQFRKFFNPFKDRIAVIPYNTAADPNSLGIVNSAGTITSFGSTATQWSRFKNYIWGSSGPGHYDGGLVPMGNTNPADGLITAREVVRSSGYDGEVFYVFFTDGAPNGGRFRWGNTSPLQGSRTNDWYLFSYSLGGAPTMVGPNTNRKEIPIASGLIHSDVNKRGTDPTRNVDGGNFLFNYEVGQIDNASGQFHLFPTGTQDNKICGNLASSQYISSTYLIPYLDPPTNSIPNANYGKDPRQDISKFRDVFDYTASSAKGCLTTNFAFWTPGNIPVNPPNNVADWPGADMPLTEVDPLVPSPTGGKNSTFTYFEQLFYYSAILAADNIRKDLSVNNKIYAIGLGSPSATYFDSTNNLSDPFQDQSEAFYRKDVFLKRLALDPSSMGDAFSGKYSAASGSNVRSNITIPNTSTSIHSRTGLTEKIGTGKLENGGAQPINCRGAYFGLSDANYLSDVFTQIAKQILLRLK